MGNLIYVYGDSSELETALGFDEGITIELGVRLRTALDRVSGRP